MGKNALYLKTYPLLVTVVALTLLVVLGVTGQLYWSYPLVFLAVGSILSEWLVINLPQGDRLTLSIIFLLLALLFSQEETTPLRQVTGAVEVMAVGALIGYGVFRRPPLLQAAFYTAQYILATSLAGIAYLSISEHIPAWFITSFHLLAVTAYVVVFSIFSSLMVNLINKRILQGEKLPRPDPLFAIFLAPISLSVYYFFSAREFKLSSLIILALPILGVLATFRLYINIDTGYGEVQQLYKISQSFVAAMSREETVQKVSESIAEAIQDLVDCNACLIYARNQEANEYLLANLESGKHGPVTVMPDEGLLGHILTSSKGDIVNDVTQDQELSAAERKWTAKTAIMAYPLFAENLPVGLMVLVRYRREFTSEHFRIVGIVANQAGVTLHNAQMYEQSLQMADTDRQLNVLNQTAFTQQAQRAMGRAQIANQSIALLLGDIDDFRKVNNTYGHQTGDKVLAGVAGLMKQEVKEIGFVGRWGGEEFVILLNNTGEQDALDIAEQIRQQIESAVFEANDGRQVQATISTGVALFPRDASDIVGLVKQADRAAYLAKRMGKNQVRLYQDQKEKLASSTGPVSKPSATAEPQQSPTNKTSVVQEGHA